MKQGIEAYQQGDYTQAGVLFEQARLLAENVDNLDPATAHLNLGTTLLRQGSLEEGVSQLEDALKTDQIDVQQAAQYNLGHAFYQQAEQQKEQQALDAAKGFVEKSVKHFHDSLVLQPEDLSSKKNFELARNLQREILQLIEQQPPQQQSSSDQNDPDNKDSDDKQQQQQTSDSQDQQNRQNSKANQQQNQTSDQQHTPPSSNEEDSETQQQPAPQAGDEGDPQDNANPPPAPEERTAEQMTPEEAEMLLESMREEEQNMREKYRVYLGNPVQVDKDW